MDREADDRPLHEAVARSVRQPSAWMVAAGLAFVVVGRWAAFGAPSARALVGALVVIALPSATVAACLGQGRRMTAAAVVLACSATVVAASADGRWQGVLALVVVALAAWSDRRDVQLALGLVASAGFALWWRSGFDRGAAPGPSWRELAGETGSTVRRVVASVGVDEVLVPLSGALAWWLGVGVVVGAALVGGRLARACWVPVALGVLVVGVWAIRSWRGSVDPIGATWIVAVGIVLAAAGRHDAAIEQGAERRLAATVVMLAAFGLAAAVVRELRAESSLAAAVAAVGAVMIAVSPAVPRLVTRVSGRGVVGHAG